MSITCFTLPYTLGYPRHASTQSEHDEDEKTPSSEDESDESEDEPILPAVDPDFVISPPKTLMEDAAEAKGEQVGTMIVVGLIFLAAANYLT